MNEIINNNLTNELKYENTVVLKYNIQYSEIKTSEYSYGKERFNTYNKDKAYALESFAKETLYPEAIELYKYNKENGYPIMIYEVVTKNTITYNKNNIVSLYNDQYIFSGGAHGNTIRTSQNWNLKIGKMITLSQLYPNNQYFLLDILRQINEQVKKQIEDGTNQYFDNYCELILETFNPENFYLHENNIVIFFQQYDIAPYSSGIPTFHIDYKE